jgi:hypothetical protein
MIRVASSTVADATLTYSEKEPATVVALKIQEFFEGRNPHEVTWLLRTAPDNRLGGRESYKIR